MQISERDFKINIPLKVKKLKDVSKSFGRTPETVLKKNQ